MAGMKSKMYKDSPKMSRSESGHMEVTRHKENHMEKHGGTAGTEEAIPHHARHSHERHLLHAKHEMEHAMHDHVGAGSKGEMYGRHGMEREEMNARHEGEIPSGMGPETGGGQVSKVENQE